MLPLASGDTLAAVASAATDLTYTIFGMELDQTTTPNGEAYKVLSQGQISNVAGNVYQAPVGPPAKTGLVKGIHVANTNAGASRTMQWFRGGTGAANAMTPTALVVPAGGMALYIDGAGWMFYNALGQLLTLGAAQGATPSVLLASAAAAGVAATFLRTDDTIRAFDGTTPPTIAAAGATGTAAFAARSDHTHTIGSGIVTRTMLEATGKNWQFLGQATANAAVRTGTITWTGTYKQLMFEYHISGYNGAAIGRLIVGPTAGLSETGTTFCTNLIEGVTQNTTSVSVPGWPTAVTAAAVRRHGWMFVKNVFAEVKSMTGVGNHSGTAATVVPVAMKMDGLFSDAVNGINKAELAVYAAITGATISTTTFNASTYLNVWGRNDD